ncbi:unnamed protein product [Closterium sp. NIES-64]|nr:unnamed protein product [Closterium sp. NIES-64]
MSYGERKGVRPGKDGDWDWDYEDVSRRTDDISMENTGDVSLGGIGSTRDDEDDRREEAAALLQDYRYRQDSTREHEQDYHTMHGVSASGAGAGGEGEDFDEFQQGGGGGQVSMLTAPGVDERGMSRAGTQGHGRPVAEQYEDSDQVFSLEAAAGVDKREAGEWDHDQMHPGGGVMYG